MRTPKQPETALRCRKAMERHGRIERALTRAYHAGGIAAIDQLFTTKTQGDLP